MAKSRDFLILLRDWKMAELCVKIRSLGALFAFSLWCRFIFSKPRMLVLSKRLYKQQLNSVENLFECLALRLKKNETPHGKPRRIKPEED